MTNSTYQLIRALPKAELHIHIEGSLQPELLFMLAKRNNISLPYASVEQARAAYSFTDLQSFLDIYYQAMKVLLTRQDFYDLTMAYMEKAHKDNVRHAEIFFDPQAHTSRSVAFATVVDGITSALADARQRFGISSYLILCFLRHLPASDAMETLHAALPYKDKIQAVGLDSSEVGHPPEKFVQVFATARKHGFLTCAHVGEEGPADYIWQALRLLKVKRIDHGVRCFDDASLVSHLVNEQIPLTVCPLSNVKLRIFPSIDRHNITQMLDKGIVATVNSDDPAYFGGYINDNFDALHDMISRKDIIQLAKNSFRASFLAQSDKQYWITQIDNITSRN